MNSHEIVMHVVKAERMNVLADLLAKTVRQSRESAVRHSETEILALDVAGADVLHDGGSQRRFLLAASAYRWAIAPLFLQLWRAEMLLKNAVVNASPAKVVDDRAEVHAVPVGRQLHASSKALRQIVDEQLRRPVVPIADPPRADKLGVGIHRDPRPHVARVGVLCSKLSR